MFTVSQKKFKGYRTVAVVTPPKPKAQGGGKKVPKNKFILMRIDQDASPQKDLEWKDEIILEKGESLSYSPNFGIEREIILACGPSGSGKSYFLGKYVKEYTQKKKVNDYLVISLVPKDSALDRYDPERPMLDDLPDIKEIPDSLVVFDDTESIPDKKLLASVNALRDQILTIGRHNNISCLLTQHNIQNGHKSRTLLNETHGIVIYPRAGGTYQIRQYLKTYIGLSKKKIDRILSLPSRAVLVYKQYPNFVLHDKGVYSLS